MSTKKRVSVMLDADLTAAINQIREESIRLMNQKGVFGLVAEPSAGFIVRKLLRERLGIKSDDDLSYQS